MTERSATAPGNEPGHTNEGRQVPDWAPIGNRCVFAVQTSHPCPPWCEKPAGHPFVLDAAESEHPARMHLARVREATAEQLELLELTADGVTVVADEVTIFHTEDHDPWTVEAAIAVARDLSELAAAVQGGAR